MGKAALVKMKKLCAFFIAVIIAATNIATLAYEDTRVSMLVNGKQVSFLFPPTIRDGVTYVDIKTLAKSLGLDYKTYPGHDSVIISNSRTSICFVPGEEYATVADLTGKSDEEFSYRQLTAPCIYMNSYLAVAARDVASVFGYILSYDKDSGIVYFGFAPQMISDKTRESVSGQAYYFQNQTEFNLPSYGSGYCWTCSYAMLITNVTGLRITPADVAAINLQMSGRGEYCYHSEIVSQLGVKFVPALLESSPYYGGRDGNSGGTYIVNPQKDDNIVRAAIKEALDLHPEGVMVRYAAYPHTMVAVAYEGDLILFNDPAPSSSGAYSDTGRYQCVPFSETCVGKKGFTLSDITFMQALEVR